MIILQLCVFVFCCLSELWAYKNFRVDHPDVCVGVSKQTLRFGDEKDSGIIVRYDQNSIHNLMSLMWNKGNSCTFDVKSRGIFSTFLDHPSGIFAVIQFMKLRRNLTSHDCIDYIQFKDSKGKVSNKLCGDLLAMNVMDNKYIFDNDDDDDDDSDYNDEVSLLTFNDPYGSMTVYIHIDKLPLKKGEKTEFQIVFTAYKHCSNHQLYKMCHDDRSKCIYEGFFNDGIVNCPYYDCVDENGCTPILPENVNKPLSIGSQVLIGSATSLAVSFITFGICLYICRKYGKLCWAEDFSRPPLNIRIPPADSNIEIQATVAESANLHTPTAPALDLEDKDLPPSYESLFPHEQTTNR